MAAAGPSLRSLSKHTRRDVCRGRPGYVQNSLHGFFTNVTIDSTERKFRRYSAIHPCTELPNSTAGSLAGNIPFHPRCTKFDSMKPQLCWIHQPAICLQTKVHKFSYSLPKCTSFLAYGNVKWSVKRAAIRFSSRLLLHFSCFTFKSNSLPDEN